MLKTTVLLIFSFILVANTALAAPMKYIYHPPEATDDSRYDYPWALLKLALEQTRAEYGDYILEAAPIVMNEKRQYQELRVGSDTITVMIATANKDKERQLIPVRIPLDKGLLGYRVLLIDKRRQQEFSQIQTLEQLKPLVVGQGVGWQDVEVWENNGFKVIEGTSYPGLFYMLVSGRYDFFSRGIVEVIDEYNRYKNKLPNLAVEESLLIYYPWPQYFYFTHSDAGQRRAERVEKGLRAVFKNPMLFNPLFNRYHAEALNRYDFKLRKVLYLKNPMLSDETPLDDPLLWLNPLQFNASNNAGR
ncbi:amino acid ABC transporter substrate-binding protein [Gallaecimonas mangrovi]|uniref:amino acid ABC transporter substrate-binding protein n=1 Tax=Gallaecimonas mangrovi TaxID=2291597 RepID=UPI000E1FC87D|nr:amino acid ABC transporter substrate-binding protein [Gallaecimonas mangrovi]